MRYFNPSFSDELSVKNFHSKCDGKGPTLSIIQSKGYLYGGYNADSWASPDKATCKFNPSSFLFTLTNPHNKDSKASITQDKHHLVNFGQYGCDMIIEDSLTSLFTFPKQYEDTTEKGNATFTGEFESTVSELLVFTVQ